MDTDTRCSISKRGCYTASISDPSRDSRPGRVAFQCVDTCEKRVEIDRLISTLVNIIVFNFVFDALV